jgi:hypothetical protein
MLGEWSHPCLATQNTPGGVLSHGRCSINDPFVTKSHHHRCLVTRRGWDAPVETDNQRMIQSCMISMFPLKISIVCWKDYYFHKSLYLPLTILRRITTDSSLFQSETHM